MNSLLRAFLVTASASFRARRDLALENLALRHQLAVLQRSTQRPRISRVDRVFWVVLSRIWPRWSEALVLVRPATVVAWHRKGFRLYWTRKSRKRAGRPSIPSELRALIRKMSTANPLWGAPRTLGIDEVLIAPRSPWQSPYVERLIGSLRRECLDHLIVLSERHVRRVLSEYLRYYHRSRSHLSLHKDCPETRPVEPPERGKVIELPQVGGLHHRYTRRAA